MRVSWFATGGSFDVDHTGRLESEFAQTTSDDTWTAPKDPGPVFMWVVLRDDRGGVDWQEFSSRCPVTSLRDGLVEINAELLPDSSRSSHISRLIASTPMARILVIEDESDIRQVLDYNLKSAGTRSGRGFPRRGGFATPA